MTNCNNVVYSCVSYRRNIKDMLFVNKLSDHEQAISIARSLDEIFGEMLEFKSLKNISLLDCLKMEELGIFTKELVENKDISAYGTSENKETMVFVNEQDHIRIQVQKKGFCLADCFKKANELDDIILDKLEITFDNNFGYLTANPFLMGTGMEVSCALFVPALVYSKKFKQLCVNLLKNEFKFFSINGEEWDERSPFVIIKNIFTFGCKENQFAEKLQRIVEKILELEKLEDNNQFNLSSSILVNNIFRAYGLLTNSYRLNYLESEENLGYVLWGINLNILKCKNKFDLVELLGKIKEKHLGNDENVKETEKARARLITDIVANNIIKGDVDV